MKPQFHGHRHQMMPRVHPKITAIKQMGVLKDAAKLQPTICLAK